MTTWFSASARVVPQLRAEWPLGHLGRVAHHRRPARVRRRCARLERLQRRRRVSRRGRTCSRARSAPRGQTRCSSRFRPGRRDPTPLRHRLLPFSPASTRRALKLMATWFRRGRGTALGVLVGALTLGSAVPHLVNGLRGLTADGRLRDVGSHARGRSPRPCRARRAYLFPQATFDPHQARKVFANRGVRLASLGYFGHCGSSPRHVGLVRRLLREHRGGGCRRGLRGLCRHRGGALGCWVGGVLGDRVAGPRRRPG